MARLSALKALSALRDTVPRKQIGKHLPVSLLLINIVICLAAFSFGFTVYGTIQAMDGQWNFYPGRSGLPLFA